MKILIAITTSDTKVVGDCALRWCARLGMDTRLFVPRNKHQKFKRVVDDTNYHYYLDFTYDQIISRVDQEKYAWLHGYDLLVEVPPNLLAWKKGTQFNDKEIYIAYGALANARLEFGAKPRKRIKRWHNGVVMRRIK